jgi:hypothetical protein
MKSSNSAVAQNLASFRPHALVAMRMLLTSTLSTAAWRDREHAMRRTSRLGRSIHGRACARKPDGMIGPADRPRQYFPAECANIPVFCTTGTRLRFVAFSRSLFNSSDSTLGNCFDQCDIIAESCLGSMVNQIERQIELPTTSQGSS